MHSGPAYPGAFDGRRSSARGFTLLELLVVVLIIGVLAGMLLPALARCRESARAAYCRNNIRQLGVAAMNYSSEYGGRFPFFTQWLHVPFDSTDLTTGRLFPYVNHRAAYLCPTDKLAPKAGGPFSSGTPRDYSYSMNCALCHENDTGRYLAPAQTALFLEARLDDDDFSGVAGPEPLRGISASTLSRRHGESSMVLFSDFHVQQLASHPGQRLIQSKRFWLPTNTDDYNLSAVLPAP